MPTFLPKRETGSKRQRRSPRAINAGDVQQQNIARDPGINVPRGAFGQLEAEALGFAGNTIFNAAKKISDEQARQALAHAKARDKVNSGRTRNAVDEFYFQEAQRLKTSPHRDEKGIEINQMEITKKNAQNFFENTLTQMSTEFSDPINGELTQNYFVGESLKFQDTILDDSFNKRMDESDSVVGKATTDLTNFVAANPGFRKNPAAFREFNEKVENAKGLQRGRFQAGQIDQDGFRQWDVDTSDAIGSLEVEQEIGRIKNLGDPSGAKQLVEDIRKGVYNTKAESSQKNIDKVFAEFSSFFDKQEKVESKLAKKNQDIAVSDFMRRVEDDFVDVEGGAQTATKEDFFALTSPREITQVVDGVLVKKTLPPLVTNPTMVSNMRNALTKGKNADGDKVGKEFELAVKNRQVLPGEEDEQAIKRWNSAINEQHRQGNTTNTATAGVVDELNKWQKEIDSETGKQLADDKRIVAAAFKAQLAPEGGILAGFSALDQQKKSLAEDAKRIAYVRLEQAEKNRKDGKPFETRAEILGDISEKIDQSKGLLFFPPEIKRELNQAIRDKNEFGIPFTSLQAERILLMNRQEDISEKQLAENAASSERKKARDKKRSKK